MRKWTRILGAVLFRAVVVGAALVAASANAALVTVSSSATGGFGAPNAGFTSFVDAYTFGAGGGTVSIIATGTISLFSNNPGYYATADGILLDPVIQSPLQEAAGVAGGSPAANVGALIGIFVAGPLPGGFDAFDVGVGGDLLASNLFLIGANGSFTTAVAGHLFLGINDSLADNNVGSFSVSINAASTAVPLPGTAWLAAAGLLALYGQRRSRR